MAALHFLLTSVLLVQLSVPGYSQYYLTAQVCNESVNITCDTSPNKYINIKGVFYGVLRNTVSLCPTENGSNNTCCDRTNIAQDCRFPDNNLTQSITECHDPANCIIKPMTKFQVNEQCGGDDYQNVTAYVVVQYTCDKYLPTTTVSTTTVTTTTTTEPTTRWMPPTTTEYPNFLSIGAQAGIIVAIMIGLTLIFAAITVYKCVKYGPSDDTRKFFSKAPEPGAADDPKIIPWVPGEAQEEIYRNITEKAKAKKKRKFKF